MFGLLLGQAGKRCGAGCALQRPTSTRHQLDTTQPIQTDTAQRDSAIDWRTTGWLGSPSGAALARRRRTLGPKIYARRCNVQRPGGTHEPALPLPWPQQHAAAAKRRALPDARRQAQQGPLAQEIMYRLPPGPLVRRLGMHPPQTTTVWPPALQTPAELWHARAPRQQTLVADQTCNTQGI